MLAARPVAFKTPHAKLKNENQLSGLNNFPKTPLPPVKQLLVPQPGPSGKQTAPAANKSRKALGDKTPGVHLQNRGVKAVAVGPDGKTLIFIDQKPPSASRKSVKKARISDGFKTPDPATRKPHWDVSDGDIVEEVAQLSLKEDEDYDEPEYMPPTASAPLPDYDFPSGAEIGRTLMEMARTAQFDYDKPPPSFEIEAFLVPDDQLVVPLSYLPPEPIPFVDDEFSYEESTTNQTPTIDSKANVEVKPGGRITRSQTGSLRTPQSQLPRATKSSLRAPTTSSSAKAPLFSHRVQTQGARPKASARRLSARGSQAVREPSQDQNEVSSLHNEIPSAKIHPGLAKLFEEAVIPIDDVRFDEVL